MDELDRRAVGILYRLASIKLNEDDTITIDDELLQDMRDLARDCENSEILALLEKYK